nr:hypothetical protein Iba_chr02dCG8480 [Ipomoea batatas]
MCCHPLPLATPDRTACVPSKMIERQRRGVISFTILFGEASERGQMVRELLDEGLVKDRLTREFQAAATVCDGGDVRNKQGAGGGATAAVTGDDGGSLDLWYLATGETVAHWQCEDGRTTE